MDDFLETWEYLDTANPKVTKDIIKCLNDIQTYVNDMYRTLNVTTEEWERLSKEVMSEEPKTDNDEGVSGFREDHGGDAPSGGTPVRV